MVHARGPWSKYEYDTIFMKKLGSETTNFCMNKTPVIKEFKSITKEENIFNFITFIANIKH